jgi:transposase
VEDLEALVIQLQAQIEELTTRLKQNSNNSSKPPSSDPPWNKQDHAKPRSPLKRGGQPGHLGHYRKLIPREQVTQTVRYFPKKCDGCGATLPQKPQSGVPEPTLHQVVELPERPLEVTQHEGHACRCVKCGYVTRAEIPAEVRAHVLGPRLTAFIAVLTGVYHLSKRQVQGLFETALGTKIGLGSIPNHERETTTAITPAYNEVREAAQQSPVKNIDETGWNRNGKLCWLWVVATATVAFYQITKSRGKKGFREVLRAVCHRITTDRWGAYSDWPLENRQLCWSHLGRDFQRFYEMTGTCQEVGRAGRRAHRRLFKVWRRFKEGLIDRVELQRQMKPVQLNLERALQGGRDSPDKKAKRFSKRLLKVYPALWTFITVEGVEPTNNHAERMVRPPVLWRKVSFGNNSASGCNFTASILTVVQTLRLQRKPVLEYLSCAIIANRGGAPCPTVL